jgi:hypothetical protein
MNHLPRSPYILTTVGSIRKLHLNRLFVTTKYLHIVASRYIANDANEGPGRMSLVSDIPAGNENR